MSLYGAIFGKNPLSALVLEALGVGEADVPRFRDAYYDGEGNRLVIHTRTGGGNRDFYEHEDRCRAEYPEYFTGENQPEGPWNADLRKIPGFLYDADDDYDCTYADWYYSVPEAFAPIFSELKALGAGSEAKPAERWQSLLAGMREGEQTPDVKRALAVGEAILGQIKATGASQ